jgi:cation diffusion facilitator family transporter
VEDKEEITDVLEETRQIERLALYAFLLNLGLAAVKGFLSLLSGSLALTASAIDSGTDSIASILLYGGLKLSLRKTPSFPLGLYKIENLISVVVAFFIFFTGYEIAQQVVTPMDTLPHISSTVVVSLFGATVVTFIFGQYAAAVGEKTGSPTLKAEGKHRRADVLSSAIVLVSVTMSYLGLGFHVFGISIDQIAAAIIVIFIAHAGWGLLSDGMRVLLDASIDLETLRNVRKIIEKEPAVSEVRGLVGRNAGRFRFVQADVALRVDDLERAHQISQEIEKNIRTRIPRVERVSIHYAPQSRERSVIAAPLKDRYGRISPHFGEAPYFAIVVLRKADEGIYKQEIVVNPYLHVERGKGIQVAEWLIEKNIDALIVREEMKHKGPGYVFSNAGIKIHVLPTEWLEEAIAALIREKGRDHREA